MLRKRHGYAAQVTGRRASPDAPVMGPCQEPSFCSQRAAGIARTKRAVIDSERANGLLRLFLKNRWMACGPSLYGKQARQAVLDAWIRGHARRQAPARGQEKRSFDERRRCYRCRQPVCPRRSRRRCGPECHPHHQGWAIFSSAQAYRYPRLPGPDLIIQLSMTFESHVASRPHPYRTSPRLTRPVASVAWLRTVGPDALIGDETRNVHPHRRRRAAPRRPPRRPVSLRQVRYAIDGTTPGLLPQRNRQNPAQWTGPDGKAKSTTCPERRPTSCVTVKSTPWAQCTLAARPREPRAWPPRSVPPPLQDGIEIVGLPAVQASTIRTAWRGPGQSKLGHPVFEIPIGPSIWRAAERTAARMASAKARVILGSPTRGDSRRGWTQAVDYASAGRATRVDCAAL